MICIRNEAARFEHHAMPVTESGCWLWIGPCANSGYGTARTGGKNVRAHRYSWELHRGQIPDGLVVCHKCDTPSCVNPDHLFLGTQADNASDRDKKKRASTGARHSATLIHGGVRKLTEEQVLSIRSDTRPNSVIAAELGVTKENISAIKRRDTWRHV